jgi:hypothetical protein
VVVIVTVGRDLDQAHGAVGSLKSAEFIVWFEKIGGQKQMRRSFAGQVVRKSTSV